MKSLMVLTVGVCLLIGTVPAMADQAEDEAAIREVVEQIFAAMKKHDAKTYAALWAEDCETWDGSIKGRTAWAEAVSDTWERQKDRQYTILEEVGIVFVTPDVAIYKAIEELTGTLDADGKPIPPWKRLVARVLVKKNGQWQITTYFTRPIEE